MNTRIIPLILFAVILTLAGCARFPDVPPVSGKQLVITMTVRGRINPIDENNASIRRHYFIAIDNDNDPNTGPWAAIYPPYGGNGWVTSQNADQSIGLTSYVRYDASYPGGYVFDVLPGSFFLNTGVPQPVLRSEITDNGSTLRMVVDFNQIATDAIPAEDIEQLDINFITVNTLVVSDFLVPGREWDALGPGGKDYVTIDTTTDKLYNGYNDDGHIVTDPDLDIVYWSVEVQSVASQ